MAIPMTPEVRRLVRQCREELQQLQDQAVRLAHDDDQVDEESISDQTKRLERAVDSLRQLEEQ